MPSNLKRLRNYGMTNTVHKIRRRLTLAEKLECLERLKQGETPEALSAEYKLNVSTLRGWLTTEPSFRRYVAKCPSTVLESSAYVFKDSTMDRMEQQVYNWFEQERKAGRTVLLGELCRRAKSIYDALADSEERQRIDSDEDEVEDRRDFKASRGWFQKFRRNYKLDGRTLGIMDLDDTEAAKTFVCDFKRLIVSGDYVPQQVFNAAELFLYWRRMPPRSFIYRRDRKRAKLGQERLSLLCCGNASGDFVVKPLLVHSTLNPLPLRQRNMNELPVLWRARPRGNTKKPLVTDEHFFEWLQLCFVPEVRDYLHEMQLPLRALLLLDAEMLERCNKLPDMNDFVQLELFPDKTVQLLQPLNQSVLPRFVCNYLRHLLTHVSNNLSEEPEAGVYFTWRKYNVANFLDVMQVALEELDATCWNSGWAALWPEIVRQPFDNATITREMQRIVEIGRTMPGTGFADMQTKDVEQYLGRNPSIGRFFEIFKSRKTVNDHNYLAAEDSDDMMDDSNDWYEDNEETIDITDDDDEDEEIMHKSAKNRNGQITKTSTVCNKNKLECTKPRKDTANRNLHAAVVKQKPPDLSNATEDIKDEIEENENDIIFEKILIRETTQRNLRLAATSKVLPTTQATITKPNKTISLNNLNKTFTLTQQLIEHLRSIDPQHERSAHFIENFKQILQPYSVLKAQLQQRSIRDYFSPNIT